jgi:hypothetical protein
MKTIATGTDASLHVAVLVGLLADSAGFYRLSIANLGEPLIGSLLLRRTLNCPGPLRRLRPASS